MRTENPAGREAITIDESEGGVDVHFHRGTFPWERFLISLLLISVVLLLIAPLVVEAAEAFVLLPDFVSRFWFRLSMAPVFLAIYYLATFHGLTVPNDSFSYFLSSAFYHFDVSVRGQTFRFTRHWLLRHDTQCVPVDQVNSIRFRDGWLVCDSKTREIVICDGPPKAVVQPAIDALNRAIESRR